MSRKAGSLTRPPSFFFETASKRHWPMLITLSPEGVLSAVRELGPNAQKEFVELLHRHHLLDAIIAKVAEINRLVHLNLRNENTLRDDRVKELEAENATIKRQAKARLTRDEYKARVAELSEEDLDATEIAEQMTADGEPSSPGRVRQVLSRLRRSR